MEQDKNINNENEYVMLDPNITTVLYSDILRLTIMSSGKIVQFQKDVVEVGSDLKFGMPRGACYGSPSVWVNKLSVAGK